VHHERVGISAEIGDDERHLVFHQPADEIDVTAEAIKLRDDHRRLGLAGGFQRCIELRPLLVIVLAGLDLRERLDDLEAFLISEALDQRLLCLKAKSRLALLLGADSDVGESALHSGASFTCFDLLQKSQWWQRPGLRWPIGRAARCQRQ
jgi:hypothetical protein